MRKNVYISEVHDKAHISRPLKIAVIGDLHAWLQYISYTENSIILLSKLGQHT